ncbi:HNH endonuclease signature motif containing protein [Mycoplasma sp. CSL7503-lung]|uniref:HNH endonuclease signature motif containing protein n=1 Tax=Mycoplasma sp. CSL7503-lung TaxID=536372 RepID=UPI0021D07555|nr:HNH endonuclease signature motif containing protein [Mycoplasma sp. CSL7503-lung]MCU4706681.1 HNH endonuclease [Mycoplasma sp. CSL7503-lung]
MEKIKIQVTSNLYKNLNTKFQTNKNDDLTKLSNKAIYETIYFDKYITKKYDECIFEEIEERFQGIIVNNEFVVFFSMALDNNFKTVGRNTFLSQGFYPVYNFSNSKNKKLPIKVSLNPYSFYKFVDSKRGFIPPENSTNIRITICEMKLINIEFSRSLNINRTFFDDDLFSYLNAMKQSKENNNSNNGFWLLAEDNNTINVYGLDNEKNTSKKSDIFDGAKWGDLFLSLKLLSMKRKEWKINELNFIIYENYEKESYKKKLKLIRNMGFNIVNIFDEQKNINIDNEIDTEDDIKRRQSVFKNKILKHYKFKNECFTCDYPLNLVASHIHRFTDIKSDFKNGTITKEEAQSQVIDGANGFLLCPNHDKEFEMGFIYFDLNEKKFKFNEERWEIEVKSIDWTKNELAKKISERLKEKKLEIRGNNIIEFKKRLSIYVKKHHIRIGINNNILKNN